MLSPEARARSRRLVSWKPCRLDSFSTASMIRARLATATWSFRTLIRSRCRARIRAQIASVA